MLHPHDRNLSLLDEVEDQLLLNFHVLHRINTGPNCVIFKAKDLFVRQEVLVKLYDDPWKFLTEAQTIERLQTYESKGLIPKQNGSRVTHLAKGFVRIKKGQPIMVEEPEQFEDHHWCFVVQPDYGYSLRDFSKTVTIQDFQALQIGIQLLNQLEDFHKCGMTYGKVNPDCLSFKAAPRSSKKVGQIYLTDLSNCRTFVG